MRLILSAAIVSLGVLAFGIIVFLALPILMATHYTIELSKRWSRA